MLASSIPDPRTETVEMTAAALVRAPFAGRVHQDAPHHLRRHGKELRALLPFDFGHVHHAEIDFMDQGCGQ
jgi:hypothetical protein